MIDITFSVQGVRKKDGTIDYILILVDDISERIKAEKEILALNRELEKRVEGRTAKLLEAHELLRKRAAELETFNKAMVGREQRMLKKSSPCSARCKRAAIITKSCLRTPTARCA